jgi:hypothetical protein
MERLINNPISTYKSKMNLLNKMRKIQSPTNNGLMLTIEKINIPEFEEELIPTAKTQTKQRSYSLKIMPKKQLAKINKEKTIKNLPKIPNYQSVKSIDIKPIKFTVRFYFKTLVFSFVICKIKHSFLIYILFFISSLKILSKSIS